MAYIRNIAIIAHVDHGKTTLVDALLRQSHIKLDKEAQARELIMDSNDLERERGITIFSKNASVDWRGTKINIIDTPGHADFGGEVERVLSMADGCLLVVDAKDGPMPQTRFVLRQALKMKHRVVVVINKVDREDARPHFVLNKTFDLFFELGADDATADFPVIYASAKLGKAGLTPHIAEMTDITPLFEAITHHIPAPAGDPTQPLQLRITSIGSDEFKGRLAIGRIHNGVFKAKQEVMHINRDGKQKKYQITSLMTFKGLERIETAEVSSGDIVAIAGIPDINIGETVADVLNPIALPLLKIEEPTIKMTFKVNDSPFAGKEGKFCTSRQVRERLYKELETDMALRITDNSDGSWTVAGRGEFHIAILIERMRREGFEFQVSFPQVITKEVNGEIHVPFEQVFIETPELYSGSIIQKLGTRNGHLVDMRTDNGITSFEFIIPTRGLFGYRSEFMTDTKGMGIINTMFFEYRKDPANWKERTQGSLIAHETGMTRLYGLLNVQDRGVLFFGPTIEVYKGQVVGQNSRKEDMSVNVCKEKQLSNMRSRGEGVSEHFNTPRTMGLEDALEYIDETELVEVTPKNIRIRKMVLDKNEQKRVTKQGGK